MFLRPVRSRTFWMQTLRAVSVSMRAPCIVISTFWSLPFTTSAQQHRTSAQHHNQCRSAPAGVPRWRSRDTYAPGRHQLRLIGAGQDSACGCWLYTLMDRRRQNCSAAAQAVLQGWCCRQHCGCNGLSQGFDTVQHAPQVSVQGQLCPRLCGCSYLLLCAHPEEARCQATEYCVMMVMA